MNDYITISLSKYGKNKGKFEAVISTEDAILAESNWCVSVSKYTNYALRKNDRNKKPNLISLHREVMKRMLGHDIPDGMEIDHIDGNGLNCARPNLRLATKSQNGVNRGKNKNNTSGYKGVQWSKQKNKWMATIWVKDKSEYIGYFDTRELAYEAYCQKAKELHGEFANLGD